MNFNDAEEWKPQPVAIPREPETYPTPPKGPDVAIWENPRVRFLLEVAGIGLAVWALLPKGRGGR